MTYEDGGRDHHLEVVVSRVVGSAARPVLATRLKQELMTIGIST